MTIAEAKAAFDVALVNLVNAQHEAGLTSTTFADGTQVLSRGLDLPGVTVIAKNINGKGVGG